MNSNAPLDNLPDFPAFRPATLDDRSKYNQFYAQFEPYSDFSFNNLWIWFNQNGNLAFSWHEGNLVIRIDNPFDNGACEYTLLGKKDCGKAMQRILRWQKAMGIEQKIAMVPKVVIDNMGKHPFTFNYEEDLDNRDYLYDVAKMHLSSGHEYMKYRHAKAHFAKHYLGEWKIQNIDISNLDNRNKVMESLHGWTDTYRQSHQAEVEGAALVRLMDYAGDLPVNCLGLYLDGVLQSFALYQFAPQDGCGIVNHIKCNNEYHYIFDVMVSYVIAVFNDKGLSLANLEQDLGLPGLRTHKERLRPAAFLARYTVRSQF